MRSWGQSGLMIFPLVKSWITNVLELQVNWHLELTGDMASGMSVCGRYYQSLTPGKFHPGDVTEQSMWPCSQEFTFSPQTRNSRSNSHISNSEMAPVNKGIPRRGPQSQTLTESSCLRPVMASLRWAESAWQTGGRDRKYSNPFHQFARSKREHSDDPVIILASVLPPTQSCCVLKPIHHVIC